MNKPGLVFVSLSIIQVENGIRKIDQNNQELLSFRVNIQIKK